MSKQNDWQDKLGLNSQAWQWRKQRWRRAWENFSGKVSGSRKQITYGHKICPECGSLVSREDANCPRCGHALGSWNQHVLQRMATQILPEGKAVTSVLMSLNICIFLFGFVLPSVFHGYLIYLGGMWTHAAQGHVFWYQFFSAGFIHGNLMHIAFNMMACWSLGPALEKEFGSRRFLGVYLVSLLGGTFLRWAWPGAEVPGVGASGAVMGLIGAGITYGHLAGYPTLRDLLLSWVRNMVLFSIIMEIAGRAGGGVRLDHLAHIGGFLAGAGMGALVARDRLMQAKGRWKQAFQLWGWGGLALSLAALASITAAFQAVFALMRLAGQG